MRRGALKPIFPVPSLQRMTVWVNLSGILMPGQKSSRPRCFLDCLATSKKGFTDKLPDPILRNRCFCRLLPRILSAEAQDLFRLS